MADKYPDLDMGREGGIPPSKLRTAGRSVAVVGAIVDGEAVYYDNGVLAGKSKAEAGITFGPEVLRAVGGRRVLALWLTAYRDEAGRDGWFGLTVGEMRIDALTKKEGFRDVNGWQTKMTDSTKGRVAVWQMKDAEKKSLVILLGQKPDLWRNAVKSFRETVLASNPEMASLDAAAADGAPGASAAGAPQVPLGAEGGIPASTLRTGGRDLTVVGGVVEGGNAYWDNGLIVGKSKAEQGITFGHEVLRALGGKRVCGLWVSVARQEDGKPGWFGAAVGDMRIDAAKKDGFRDPTGWGMKLNDAARGRVELGRLKPEERKAVGDLLQAQADLWENAFEGVRSALE